MNAAQPQINAVEFDKIRLTFEDALPRFSNAAYSMKSRVPMLCIKARKLNQRLRRFGNTLQVAPDLGIAKAISRFSIEERWAQRTKFRVAAGNQAEQFVLDAPQPIMD